MRRAAATDANQAEIVDALRRVGATVQPMHQLGAGCPDLLVGFRGKNFALELKDGAKSPSRRALTDDEKRWHAAWRGQVVVVETVEQALAAIGVQASGLGPRKAAESRTAPLVGPEKTGGRG